MSRLSIHVTARHLAMAAVVCFVPAIFGACALRKGTAPSEAIRDAEIADVLEFPQRLAPYADAAGERLAIAANCRAMLLKEFRSRLFAPWTDAAPLGDPAEAKEMMGKVARGRWYGANRRLVPPGLLREILDGCALESFPSRNEKAIAVVPAHLRGLPTPLPLFTEPDDYPFDMLEYPHVKLNEPLRVLHASRDGIWLFVETAYSSGWIEARDVALVDREFIASWVESPQLVIVRDCAPIRDESEGVSSRAKIGTILPLVAAGQGYWEVAVATVGKGGNAVRRTVRIPREMAAPHPLPFDRESIALIGDQLLGQPYGWGEMYGLRDCSAMLRDFFLPFGIWLPRTAADQVASVRRRIDLSGMVPGEKEEVLRRLGLPFLTLFYKPGHIMLYVGTGPHGEPLVLHNAWSVRVRDGGAGHQQYIGKGVVTTLEPGRELGLVEGGTLLEQGTAMATITDRCAAPPESRH